MSPRRIEIPASAERAPAAFLRELAAAVDAAALPGSTAVAYLCYLGREHAAIVPADVGRAAERHYRDTADELAAEAERERGRD